MVEANQDGGMTAWIWFIHTTLEDDKNRKIEYIVILQNVAQSFKPYTKFLMLFQEHLAKHAGDKPYKCEVCPKQFNHKTDLRRHMCLHTGEKPFTCDVCGKGFIREDRMVKHADTHKKKAQVGGGLMWQQADTGGHVYWPGGQVSGHHHMWLPVHVAARDFRSTWLARQSLFPSDPLSWISVTRAWWISHFLWSIPWQDITHVSRVHVSVPKWSRLDAICKQMSYQSNMKQWI